MLFNIKIFKKGDTKMKLFAKICTIVFALALVLCIASCGATNTVQYTVSFDSDGGESVESIKVDENGKINEPTSPTKAGYTFMGWYCGETKWDFAESTVTSDTKLTAKWSVVNYTLGFSLGGGTAEGEFPEGYTVEDDSISIPNPTREGYTFAGWTYEGAEAPVRDLVIRAGTTGNKSYTAVWTVIKYNINVSLGGGTPGGSYPTDYTVEDGTITFERPTRDGYDFKGWSVDGSDALIKDLSIDATLLGDRTLTAVWTVIKYNITVSLGGGTPGGSYPTDYTVEDGTITFERPTRDGYDFDGWSVDGSDALIKDLSIDATLLGDKTIAAVWTVIKFNITIELDGGTAGGTYPVDYTIEDSDIIFDDPTRNGYDFGGWLIEGSDKPIFDLQIDAGSVGDIKITAIWIVIEFNITIELDGGTASGTYPTDYTIEDDDIVIADPTRDGYEFGGWSVEGEDEPVFDLTIDKGSVGDKSFTAIWIIIRYNITYVLGDNAANGNNPSTYTVEDSEIILDTPTKDYYDFKGWLINGEAGTSITAGSFGSITVTAIWTPTKYSINYHNCPAGTGSNKTVYTYEDEVIFTDVTRPGYKFVGWFRDAELADAVTSIPKGSHDAIDVYAKWEIVRYTISYDLDGGTLEAENPESYTVEDEIELNAPTKDGFTFVGWQIGDNTVSVITKGTTGSINAKAVWKLYEYKITYVLNGGTNAFANSDVFNVESEFDFANAIKTGYDFVGWYTDNALTAGISGITKGMQSDITVYASWNPTEYVINVNLNGGTTDVNIPESYTIESDSITLPTPTREHYVFTGWLINNVSTDTISTGEIGEKFAVATWKLADYDIDYVLGGGKNNDENPKTFTYEDTVTFKAPSRDGYRFDGWYSDSGFTSLVSGIGKGTSGTFKVYAKWVPITYNITYILYNGTNAESNPATFTVEDLPLRLGEATKLNLFFDAWYTEETFDNAISAITAAGDIIVYARFVPATEGINYTISEDGTYYTVTGYTGTESKVIIASTYENLPVTAIAAYAFQNLDHVKEIVIPTSVTSIAQYAITGCNYIERITVPYIGSSPSYPNYPYFGYIFGATSQSSNKNYVPSSLKHVTVTAGTLTNYAFYGCSSIESVEIRATMTIIPTNVFYNCSSLKSFTIPNTVTTIGSGAFSNCTGLTELFIPDSVETIESAFYNLSTIKIYFECESAKPGFASYAFDSCRYVYYNCTGIGGTTDDGFEWLLLYDGTAVITHYLGEETDVTVPATVNGYTVSKIGPYAFYDMSSIKAITLPDTITEIGDYAFEYCTFAEIELPESLKVIGRFAFHRASLTKIVIPKTVDTVGWSAFYDCPYLSYVEVYAKNIEGLAFQWCSAMTTLIIGEGVEVIAESAFRVASSCTLTEITVPSSVISIGKGAFEGMSRLQKITLPFIGASRDAEGYKSMFGYIFGYTEYSSTSSTASGILQYSGQNDNGYRRYFYYNIPSSISEVVITDCDTVPSGSFKLCNGIKRVTIACDLTLLSNAFSGLSGLEEVILLGKIDELEDSAFNGCSSLKSIDLSGVRIIGDRAFINTHLTSVTLGEGVEAIGEYAFAYITTLTEISFPSTLKSIGANAFYDTNLFSLKFNDGIESIGEYAFYACDELTEIFIPDSLTTVGQWAFGHCGGATVYLQLDSEPAGWGYNWSYGTKAVVWGYSGVSGTTDNGLSWILTKDGTVTITGYSGGEAEEIIIPATIDGYIVTKIGANLFSQNYSVAKVVISEGITHIGDSAFSNSSDMIIVLPSTITSIGSEAFYNVNTLTAIPPNVEYIGDFAFSECDALTEVVLGDSLVSIGLGAFRYTNITKITLPFVGATADGTDYAFIGYIFGAEQVMNSSSYIPETLISVTVGSSRVPNYAFYGCNYIKEIIFTEEVSEIGTYAFYNCYNLTDVTLLGELITVGNNSFYGTSITSIDLSHAVSIGDYAFTNTKLESVEFSDSLTSIGQYAFANTNIKSVVIPESVTWLGSEVFASCLQLTNATVNLIGALPTKTFSYCTALTDVTLCDGITSIGSYAFESCISLSRIDLSCIKTIGNYAFQNCAGIVELDTGNTLETIGSYAFQYCTSLIKLRLGTAIGSIGTNAFIGASKLYDICNDSSLTLTAGSNYNGYVAYYAKNIYSSTSGSSCLTEVNGLLLMTADGSTIVVGYNGNGGEVIIPEGVTVIDVRAFSGCTTVTSVKFPSTLVKVSDYAFENCSAITELYVPDSVTSIGKGAFSGCSSLVKITLPFAGMNATSNSNSNHVGYIFGAYSYDDTNRPHAPESLRTIVITGGTFIPEYAFSRFYNVESIILPDTITFIGAFAFNQCTSLAEITIPDSVTSMSDYVFYYCEKLTTAKLGSKLTALPAYTFCNCTALEEVILPEGITSIGSYAFNYCTSLKEVKLPSTVQYIQSNAFYNCSALEKIELSEGLVAIYDYAFRYCASLTEITIPDSVTTIGGSAFYGCNSLERITVPFIGNSATQNRTLLYIFGNKPAALKTVIITGGTDVPYQAFYGLSTIETVILPSSVTSIGYRAFYNCTSLKNIELPSSLTTIGESAFSSTALKFVFIPASVTTMGSWAFDYLSGAVVCVEAEAIPSGWSSNWIPSGTQNTVILGAKKQSYSFESNGGTQYDGIYDYVISEIPMPKKDGYLFTGWFDNAAFEGEPITSSVYYSADKTTLYARWMTEDEYKAFCNGGSVFSAYILTLDEYTSISSSSAVWFRFTAEEDMYISVSFYDGSSSSWYTKYIYVYGEDGSTQLTYGYSSSTAYCSLNIKAGETIYIKAQPGAGSSVRVTVTKN